MDPSQQQPPPTTSERKGKKSEALWLMSFSDMSLVLLCFFVLMISTMKPDRPKYENIKEGMKETPTEKVKEKKTTTLRHLSKKIIKVIKEKKLEKKARVFFDSDGIKVEFRDGMLFKSGGAQTNPKFKKVVNDVLSVIAEMSNKYRMTIEGHTDDLPIKSRKFPSNWELSAARGFSLMRKFHRLGIKEDKISVMSYAHTRPRVDLKTVPKSQWAKARATNRRVVIWIE